MQFKRLALLGAIGSAIAQRPSDVSICDYYTAGEFLKHEHHFTGRLAALGPQTDKPTALLGSASGANEYAVLTILVNTAVIGNYSACAAGSGLPGILAPAVYGGEDVNLLPYFDGCLISTNVNNVPSSVNFLDGGGAAPLMMNLPADDTSSNQ